MKIKKFFITIIFLALSASIIFSSCKHGCGHEGRTSSAGSGESHNIGLNCLNCHSATGEGDGCFSVAGTVYQPSLTNTSPGVEIKLYSQPNGAGETVATLTSDQLGNFYTGKDVPFGKLYPAVYKNGKSNFMQEPISAGACNSCHGVTTTKLFADM